MDISCLWGIARYYVQLVRQDRVAQAFFISLLLLITPLESNAGGNVAPILNTSAPPYVKYDGYAGLWDTPDEACRQFLAVSSWSTWGYSGVEPIGNGIFKCLATPNGGASHWISNVLTVWSCDGSIWGRSITACTRRECPGNATGVPAINPTTCTCDDGYTPDPAGTSCVPVTPCPIDNLTELTDPVAIDFENGNRWRPDGLTADYQSRLTCVQDGITNRGGTYVGTSAYRPTQYQQHLFEIVEKDYDLDASYMSAHPECQALRNRVSGEMAGHGLRFNQDVAIPGTSRHESGTAFDITPSGLTDAQLTSVYSGCGVTHTAVPGEPWHVQ